MVTSDFKALAIAAAAMTLIVGVRYLAVSGMFAWLGERRLPGLYAGLGPQIQREIGWSLFSSAIYGMPAGIVAWGWRERGWTQIYSDYQAWPLWWMPLSFLFCLFLHDTWFYWTHRAMHHPALFRALHAVHHASRPPTAWAAMSFHPWEALVGAFVIPTLVFALPLYDGVVLALLLVMTVMGVTNHMGWEVFPSRIVQGRAGNWLITATHHQLHHDRYRCNYGLYFRFWDRLCGTDRGLGHFVHRSAGGRRSTGGRIA